MAEVPVWIKILGSRDGSLNAVLGKVRSDVRRLSGDVTSFGLRGATLLGGVAVSLGAIGGKALSAAAEFEALEGKLRNVLHNGAEAQKVFLTAVQTASLAPFSVDSIVKASVQLTVFRQNAQKVLPAVTDLAATFGTEAEKTATDVGKAASGSLRGFVTLRNEYGIGALELKKFGAALDSTGTIALHNAEQMDRARSALLKLIQTRYGGAAEAATHTLKGALTNLEDAITRTAASFGQALVPAATLATHALTGLLDKFEAIPAPIKTAIAITTVLGAGMAGLGAVGLTAGVGILQMAVNLQQLGVRLPSLAPAIGGLIGGFRGLGAFLTLQIPSWRNWGAAAAAGLGQLPGLFAAGAAGARAFAVSVATALGPVGLLALGAAALGAGIELWESSQKAASRALDEQSHAQQNTVTTLRLYRDAINEAAKPAGVFVESSGNVAKVCGQLQAAFKAVSTADMVASLEKAGVTLQDARKHLEENRARADALRTSMVALRDMLQGLAGAKGNVGLSVPASLKELFPGQTLVTVQELRDKFRQLNDEFVKCGESKVALELTVGALEKFQTPLANAVEESKKLDDYLKFAQKAHEAQALGEALRAINADLTQLTNQARSQGLPTDKAGILKQLETATGTRKEFLQQLLTRTEEQGAAQVRVWEQERAVENERIVQLDRRAAREKALGDVRLDDRRKDLLDTLNTETAKVKIAEGSTQKEVELTRRLNDLRKQPPSGPRDDEIERVEAHLKTVRAAADQEIAARNKVREAKKGLLELDKADAQRDLQDTVKNGLEAVEIVKQGSGATGKDVAAALVDVQTQIEGWKQGNQDLLDQSPELREAYQGAARELEGHLREAQALVKAENLQSLKAALADELAGLTNNQQKLAAVQQSLLTLEQLRRSGFLEEKAAAEERIGLQRQSLDLERQIAEEKLAQTREVHQLQAAAIDDEISTIEARKEAGESGRKIDNELKDARKRQLQARLAAIEEERQAEIRAKGASAEIDQKAALERDKVLRDETRRRFDELQKQEGQLKGSLDRQVGLVRDAHQRAAGVTFSGVNQTALPEFGEGFGQTGALEHQRSIFGSPRPEEALRRLRSRVDSDAGGPPRDFAGGLGGERQRLAQMAREWNEAAKHAVGWGRSPAASTTTPAPTNHITVYLDGKMIQANDAKDLERIVLGIVHRNTQDGKTKQALKSRGAGLGGPETYRQ